MLDTRILLGAQGVQAPDAVQGYSKLAQLAQLKQAQQLQQMQLEDAQRKRAASDAIGGALGDLDITNDEQVRTKLGQLPAEARPEFVKFVQVQREQIAKDAKERADAEGKQFGNRTAQLGFVGQLAGALAENPTPEAWRTAKRNLEAAGLNPALLDVPDGVDPRQHFGQLANSALTAAQQADHKDKAAVRAETGRHNLATEGHQAKTLAETVANNARIDSRARQANQIAGNAAAAAMTGAPQEIMVNGVPTLAIYDKRSGTFFDANTRQPIREGIGPKAGELPASTREKMAQNNVTLAKIDRAIEEATTRPESFGAMNYIPDAVRQRTDPEGVAARALVADIAGQKIHDRSGAAVTVGEMERLRPYIPAATDNPETVRKKLEMFRQEYSRVQEELAAGRSVAELMSRKKAVDAGQPAQREFQSMPDPATLAGKRIQAPDGTIYKSDGKKWVRQ
jgi:hypothetical protein